MPNNPFNPLKLKGDTSFQFQLNSLQNVYRTLYFKNKCVTDLVLFQLMPVSSCFHLVKLTRFKLLIA